MSKFKGTKGKWHVSGLDQTFVYALSEKGTNSFSLNINNDGKTDIKEQQANALLISKAPEMLEMLKKAKLELSRIKGSMMAHPDCIYGSEFDDYTSSAQEVEDEIELLINQAIEL